MTKNTISLYDKDSFIKFIHMAAASVTQPAA